MVKGARKKQAARAQRAKQEEPPPPTGAVLPSRAPISCLHQCFLGLESQNSLPRVER